MKRDRGVCVVTGVTDGVEAAHLVPRGDQQVS